MFDAEGARTQYLETMMRFVNEYQGQYQRIQLFCKKIACAGFIGADACPFTMGSCQQLRLAGFMAVNRER